MWKTQSRTKTCTECQARFYDSTWLKRRTKCDICSLLHTEINKYYRNAFRSTYIFPSKIDKRSSRFCGL